MTNPVKNLQRTAAEYRLMSAKDKKRYMTDMVLNNALYILMTIFIIYTAIEKPNFLTWGSFANLITLVAAYLPLALGIAGTIVLTGTVLAEESSRYSAGSPIAQPPISARWGTSKSAMTLDQRRFTSGWLAGVL